jgi:hypothetical protein
MASSPQYSSAQILEAARRAEAEGKIDYALQFYRHIVDHHGGSAEAYEARDGFIRLTQARRSADPRFRPPGPGSAGYPPHAPVAGASYPPPAREPLSNGAEPQRGDAYRPAGYVPPPNLPQVVAKARAVPVETAAEPEFEFKDRYRAGTFMAQSANWIGWLMVGVGVALGGAGLAGVPKALAAGALFGLPAGIVWGLMAVSGGLALVLVSQLALAVFDNANASRHLLAIERAKAEL